MDQILTALRTLLIDHIATSEAITANATLGATTIRVAQANRFKEGEEVFILSNSIGFAESNRIESIVDYQTVTLETPTLRAWLVSETTFLQKALNHQMLKGVYLGDLPSMPSFPCITISPSGESVEWFTLRSTSHEYSFDIRVYVLADNFEQTSQYLPRMASAIREVLIDHVHPVIDVEPHPLTADLPAGASVASIADTSNFSAPSLCFIRDINLKPSSENNRIATVISGTALELGAVARHDYLVARNAELLRIKRFLYDTLPGSIDMGFAKGAGGKFLKAAEIKYKAKEQICREGNLIT